MKFHIKRFYKHNKKKVIWGAIALVLILLIGFWISHRGNNAANIQTDTVKRQDLKETVLATGQVVSATDLDLSFQGSGLVREVRVKEGDKVKTGQVLAVLDQTNLLTNLTTAKGSLAQAQANYEKVVAGASSQQITVAQTAVQAAQTTLNNAMTSLQTTKTQQDTAVQNAYSTLLNTPITAITQTSVDSVVPIITGTYTDMVEGTYNISIASYTGGTQMFELSGLESSSGTVKSIPVPLGTKGLYIQFNSTPSPADKWTVTIPNTYSSAYSTNYAAYQTALKNRDTAIANAQAQINSAQAALAQAQANLDQQRAAARPADIDAAKAQILSAQGQVESAQAAISNTVLSAPADGTITEIDTKVGEQSTALTKAMVLQNVTDLHAEADVSEANVAALHVGQSVDYTFDALGPDRHFSGALLTINPASTVVSGVVNYKVTASLDNIPDVRPGMTANMTISVAQKANALAITSSAIVNQNGKQYVRVVDDPKKKTYHQVEVQTGLQADGGLVEITSGLSEGQEVVTYIKS